MTQIRLMGEHLFKRGIPLTIFIYSLEYEKKKIVQKSILPYYLNGEECTYQDYENA